MSPWWKDKKFPDLGTVYPGILWATAALYQNALQYGDSLFAKTHYGNLTKTNKELYDELVKLGGRAMTQNGDVFSFVWEHGMVCVNCVGPEITFDYVTSNLDFFNKMKEVYEAHAGPRVSAGRVYVLVNTQNGPEFKSIGVAATALERSNYEQCILNDFDHIVEDLKNSTPCGRLVVLDGIPGTGKTFLLRALIDSVPESLFIIVPANLIPELANPSMIQALMNTRSEVGLNSNVPTIFLVEDADSCLAARACDNVNSVSSLLNLGDGILGQMFDIRIICTTNARIEDLDSAITRPGRLCRHIHMDYLKTDFANKIYERLTGKPGTIKEKMTLAEVYRISRDGGWKPEPKKQALGFFSNNIKGCDSDCY